MEGGRAGGREAAAEENICPGGGARVPVHIVTSDHVRVHVTSLLMSCPPHLLHVTTLFYHEIISNPVIQT